ncbi:Lrp/AsnC family transcriptional regulator [Maledivibacter halophilus]|uniref:Transcriptional regulator, AsnC family n=1 Tax=Maledivibacter halophilus TaxID=36842 RepID=A0A1T5LKX1_9FIRM|nr:Lrp/AsnC family transcriptional regulator [Maledivibacter halophilus]SKC76534.1 transcriptional regulator, AsnC family [Maledivibacter halophilus]
MDQIDMRILNEMKLNGRSTASEISKKVNLSIPAVSERIRKLEDLNIIEHYTVKINREKMGYKLLTMVFVNLEQKANTENFRKTIIEFNEVIECHHIAGEYDYMLKLLLKDTYELEVFLSKKLKSIPGVQKSNSLIILSTLKETLNR